MSVVSRRATIDRLIISEAAAGRPIQNDSDFVSLAERWVQGEIDMQEMRALYQAVREERRRRKWSPHSAPESEPVLFGPPPSTNEFLAEIARMTRCDVNE